VYGYGYDDAGNVNEIDVDHPDLTDVVDLDTGEVLDGLSGNLADGEHTYTYDASNRLTSWTHDPDVDGLPTVDTDYEWDEVGNRTAAGPDGAEVSFVYDERNRLTDGADGVYTWTARGTLRSAGAVGYTFDALGRATQVGAVDYGYDGLDRIAARTGVDVSFVYAGVEIDPVDDATALYGRSPSGRIMSVDPTDPTGTGVDPNLWKARLAGLNRHGDLAWTADPASGAFTMSKVYDPFGQLAGQTGLEWPAAGFQGDYTDPISGEVWMGARWYAPNDAAFTTRDTVFGELETPISLNRYTYAHANPLLYFDPDGRDPRYVPYVDGIASLPTVKRDPSVLEFEARRPLSQARIDAVEDYAELVKGLSAARELGTSIWRMAQQNSRMSAHQGTAGFAEVGAELQELWGMARRGGRFVADCVTLDLAECGRKIQVADATVRYMQANPHLVIRDVAYGVAEGGLQEWRNGRHLAAVQRWLAQGAMALAGGAVVRATTGGTRVASTLARIDTPNPRPIHSRYGDGTPVFKGERPPRLGDPVADPQAMGPHSRLRWDTVNNRVYQAREFDALGHPVRDIDFTAPTYPNGSIRPGHSIPQQHPWLVNDPDIGPKSGFRRGPGGPL
jgi:RHS repeat-associated protein